MTMLIFNSAMMTLPILLGHTLLNGLPHILISNGFKNNDLHSFTAGICIIRAVSLGTSYSIKQVQTRSVGVLFNQIWHWCSTFSKSSALLSIWISVIPVMIGLLVDLVVIVLIWGPLNEVPSFALFWEWVLGSFFLVIFCVLVLLDKKELFVDVVSWRAKYKILLVFGLPQLHAVWVLHEIMVPIIFKLLILLSLPYVCAQGIFPLLGFSVIINAAVYWFSWPCFLAFIIIRSSAKTVRVLLIYLHNSVRDDRYCIGEMLIFLLLLTAQFSYWLFCYFCLYIIRWISGYRLIVHCSIELLRCLKQA